MIRNLVMAVSFLTIISLVVLNAIGDTTRKEIDLSLTTQAIAVLIGLSFGFLAYRTAVVWSRFGFIAYALSVILLGLVLLYAEPVGGASRWLILGSFQIQPSELAKLSLILVQAKLLSKHQPNIDRLSVIILSAGYTALLVWLVLLQPDLGSSIVLGVIWAAQLVFSGLSRRTLLLLLGIVLLIIPLGYPFMADYQKERIDTFFNPSLSTLEEGYNALQATIAVGSGGIFGRGLDSGSQSQLNFLPAQHTDFIFSVISEKLGFVGASLVIVAFGVLMITMSNYSLKAEGTHRRLIGIGVVALIGSQFIINVGMNLGLLPVTGIPLPFVSAGGSHIVVEMVLVGLFIGTMNNSKPALQIR